MAGGQYPWSKGGSSPSGGSGGPYPWSKGGSGSSSSSSSSSGGPYPWSSGPESSSAPKGRGAPSLLKQAGNLVAKLPSGMFHAAEQGVTGATHAALPMLTRPHDGEGLLDFIKRTQPGPVGLVESAGRTAGDIIHPSRFAQASREGTIIPKLVEDAANLSVVLGPAAGAVGKGAAAARVGAEEAATAAAAEGADAAARAAAEQAARRAARWTAAERVTSGAEKVAAATGQAPIYPYQQALRLAGKVAEPLVDLAKATPVGAKIADVVANRAAARGERQTFRESVDEANQQAAERQAVIARTSRQVESLLPKEDQQAALTLLRRSEVAPLRAALEHMPPKVQDEFLQRVFIGNREPDAVYVHTPESVKMAADYVTGRMDPALASKFDEAMSVTHEKIAGPRQEQGLAGFGYPEGQSLNPEQTGFAPLSEPIDEAAQQAMKNLPRASREAQMARGRAETAAAALDTARGDLSAQLDQRAEQVGASKLERQRATLQSAAARQEDRAATAVDRLTSAQDLAEAAKVQRPAADLAPEVQRRAGALVAANQAAAEGLDRGLASTVDRQARAESAAGRLEGVLGKAEQQGARQGVDVGRAQEQAAQAQRVARLESRRLGALNTKLDRIPDEPTPENVSPTYGMGKRLGSLETRSRVLGNVADSAEARVERIRARVPKAAAEAADKISSAPARLRPALVAARRAVDVLGEMAAEAEKAAPGSGDVFEKAAAEIPTTLKALHDQGVDAEHIIGGKLPDENKRAFSTSSTPKMKKLAAQRQRETTLAPLTARGQAILEARETRTAFRNEFAKQVERDMTTSAQDAGHGDLAGKALAKAMEDDGFVPWSAKAGGKIAPEQVTASTRFVSKTLADEFGRYFGPPGKVEQWFRSHYDPVIRGLYKAPVLALSPRWHLGNILGNTVMAAAGAGITPFELARRMVDAKRLIDNDPEAVPSRLFGKGLSYDDASYFAGPGRAPRTPVGRLIEKSYRLNGMVDDMTRSAIYLAKKSEGFSDEQAVKLALKAAGDFTKASHFERSVVRRLMPFYAWTKHITTLSLRLPIENPVRTAWILHLADLYGDDQSQLPGWAKGSIDLGGGRYLNASRMLNPFGDVADSAILSPGGFLRSLTPGLKVPAAALFGGNLSKFRQLTRPPGSGLHDENGNPKMTPLLTQPKELAYFLGRQLPQTRLAQDVPGKQVVRYETGEPIVDKKGPIPKQGASLTKTLLGPLGIPAPEQIDTTASQIKADKRRAAEAKKRQTYEKKRAKG